MKLGIRGIMDSDGDIHTWPTYAWQHSDFFAELPYLQDGMRARFRQWGSEPAAPIEFDLGYERADALRVCEYVLRIQDPIRAATPEGVLAFARKCGVR